MAKMDVSQEDHSFSAFVQRRPKFWMNSGHLWQKVGPTGSNRIPLRKRRAENLKLTHCQICSRFSLRHRLRKHHAASIESQPFAAQRAIVFRTRRTGRILED